MYSPFFTSLPRDPPEPATNTQQYPPQMDGMQEDLADDNQEYVVIPIDTSFSDGDPTKWPTEERFGRPDDTYYRQKLAEMWLKQTGAYEPGVLSLIDELPEGYVVFDRPRLNNPSIRDRFLYGHPVGQYYTSTVTFFPHFYYLMTGGTTKCPCDLCARLEKRQKGAAMGIRRGRPPGRAAGRQPEETGSEPPVTRPSRTVGRPRGRPPGRPSGRGPGRPSLGRPPGRPPGRAGYTIADSEGTPDEFKIAVTQLKQNVTLSRKITEPSSMDWRAERAGIEEYLEALDLRPSYIPRLGEIVLWAPNFDGDLVWNPATQRIQIYSPAKEKWLKAPEWRAGVIGQIPTEELILQDIVETTEKKWGLNYSGFRVETLPDPNGFDKSYSLHYSYVPLKCVKPFNSFELFLQGTPRENLHPSIENAMTIMSSFSLVEKYFFRGQWPDASILCRGIFIGAEMLAIGDAIRLKPKGYQAGIDPRPSTVDVMVIKEIRLDLSQCDEDPKSKQLAEKYQVRLSGKLYTLNEERAQSFNNGQPARPLSSQEVVDVFNNVGMGGYGDWYELHPGSIVDVSQDMVLGRCYEPDAMKLLSDSLSLSYDLQGVLSAREYSRQVDERIPEGKHWFWGDFRTQTLAIDSLNGEDAGHYSETRDMKMWRANLRIVDGIYTQADIREAKQPGELGRPSMKPHISSLVEVGKTSKLVSTGLGAVDTSNPVSSTDEEESSAASEGEGATKVEDNEQTNGNGDEIETKSESESESEPEEDFTTRIEELRGGTDESEGGDYAPEDDDDELALQQLEQSFGIHRGAPSAAS
ncbi:transcription-silencing protein Clr2-domain-containing protein [Aspergillus crustosus]